MEGLAGGEELFLDRTLPQVLDKGGHMAQQQPDKEHVDQYVPEVFVTAFCSQRSFLGPGGADLSFKDKRREIRGVPALYAIDSIARILQNPAKIL